MLDFRTVLPAPNLLDLIGIRADANVIILFAKPRPVQLVALRAASDPEETPPDTRGSWLTYPGKESPLSFVCTPQGSSATKGTATG
jgi:hypothetical protein